MSRKFPSLIINLIGSNKNVSVAKNEIRDYIFKNYFSFKEIENKYLKNEIERNFLTKDIYINPCQWITCDEIKNIKQITNLNKNHKLYSYSFLVLDNKNIINDKIKKLINCKYINNIYNINNTRIEKEDLLFSLLFSEYSKFKI